MTPPDLKQCQAEYLDGSFMTLGPRQYVRCTKPATVIVTEKKPGKDGQRGTMSLCDHCFAIFLKTYGPHFATAQEIKPPHTELKPNETH